MKNNSILFRYILFESIKVVILFTLSFYLLYILIDYSIHMKTFSKTSFFVMIQYYICNFSKRADLILPFALVLATAKVLLTLNVHCELCAFLAGGISLKKILMPIFYLGCFFTLLLYLNFETLEPLSLKKLEHIEDHHFIDQHKKITSKPVNLLPLDDQSKLIFHTYNSSSRSLHDVFWLQNHDKITHIKVLYPFQHPPQGVAVTQMARNKNGIIERTLYEKETLLDDLKIEVNSLFKAVVPVRHQVISKLIRNLNSIDHNSDYYAEVITTLNYKLSMPLLAILVIIGPASYCCRFSRTTPTFFIYSLSMVGLIAFFTIMNAAYILAENKVFSPILIIWLPFIIAFIFFGKKTLKIDSIR